MKTGERKQPEYRRASSGTLPFNGGRVWYEMVGDGSGLPVVLAHAGFVDSDMFNSIMRRPEFDSFPMVRYDMQGCGRSSNVTGPVCRRQELLALLDFLQIPLAHLVGCSMGGTTAIDFALENPGRVASLTVVNSAPGGFEPTGTMPRYLQEMFVAVQNRRMELASELQTRIWFDGPFREPQQVDESLRRSVLRMNRSIVEAGTFLLADSTPLDPLRPAAISRLRELRCPTLVIAGALDDPLLLQVADLLVAGIPGARKTIIDGAAHIPSFEKPEAFSEVVSGFLSAGGSTAR